MYYDVDSIMGYLTSLVFILGFVFLALFALIFAFKRIYGGLDNE